MLYDLIQGAATVVYLVFFTLYGKNFNISRLKSFVLGVCSMIIYLMLVKFLSWAETGFKTFGPENAIRVYVVIPVFIYLLAKIAKVQPLKLFDMQAVACVLMYGVGHYACIFGGCCYGFSYYEGTTMYTIAHMLTKTDRLPMQAIEATTAMIIFVILYVIGIKMDHNTNGRLFCLWYLIFGTQRFFWEFLRDNKKVIIFAPLKQADGYFGISNLAIWSALMVLAGVIMSVIIYRMERTKGYKG